MDCITAFHPQTEKSPSNVTKAIRFCRVKISDENCDYSQLFINTRFNIHFVKKHFLNNCTLSLYFMGVRGVTTFWLKTFFIFFQKKIY